MKIPKPKLDQNKKLGTNGKYEDAGDQYSMGTSQYFFFFEEHIVSITFWFF